jgi:DNA-binding protein HU-beta
MTQADFIQAVQAEVNDDKISKAVIKKVLDAAGNVDAELLKDGGKVDLFGLGKLAVVQRAARTGRNPRTGAAIDVPAKKAAKFTPSKAVKDALN